MPRLACICSPLPVALLALAGLTAQAPAPVQDPVLGGGRPPSFVANQGQWAAPTAFRIQRDGATASAAAGGLRLDLCRTAYADPMPAPTGPNHLLPLPVATASATVLLEFAARTPPVGERQLAARQNFLLGDQPSQWRTDVPTFGAVRWTGAWPGIDLLMQTHAAGLLEYQLEVAAGADPRAAVLQWTGADAVELLADGGLCLHTGAGDLLQSAPRAWQQASDGRRHAVPVRIELQDHGSFRFCADAREPALPLVIDPVLTYHGGAYEDTAFGVARVASSGRTIMAGYSMQGSSAYSARNVVVSCLDFSLPAPHVVWTTYLGGSGEDVAFGVAVDAAGIISCTGYTMSTNFPVVNAPYATFRGGQMDAFVTQLDPTGAAPIYSTYLGGSGSDWACAVVVDAQLRATVGGVTYSTNFPTVNAAQSFNAGQSDAFLVRVPAGGGPLDYATYFGGSLWEGFLWTNWQGFPGNIRIFGLDVDAAGRVLIAGPTWSSNFPVTAGAFQTVMASPGGNLADAFLAILDPSLPPASQKVWSTYLGTSTDEAAMAAHFGPGGTAVVGGYTYASNFPVTAGCLRPTFTGPSQVNDGFLAWFDPGRTGAAQRTYCTYLGGTAGSGSSGHDGVTAIDVDSRGHATVCGYASPGFPTAAGWPTDAGGFQSVHGGYQDAFLLRLRPSGRGRQDLTYGSYLGGSQGEAGWDVQLEPNGGAVFGGHIASAGVPLVSGSRNGVVDALVGTAEFLPTNVTRDVAGSSIHCAGIMTLEVDRRLTAGQPFELLIGNAPAAAVGVLGFGAPMPPLPLPSSAAVLVTNPTIAVSGIMFSSSGGALTVPLALPPGFPVPVGISVQAVWFDPLTCGSSMPLNLVSSAGLGL